MSLVFLVMVTVEPLHCPGIISIALAEPRIWTTCDARHEVVRLARAGLPRAEFRGEGPTLER